MSKPLHLTIDEITSLEKQIKKIKKSRKNNNNQSTEINKVINSDLIK
jgi:hypothetical protein